MHTDRSHYVRVPAHWIAGCSDIGRRHDTNQDAMCLAVRDESTAVLAIADGVTTATGAEDASLVASRTVVERLIEATGLETPADQAFTDAFESAHQAVLDARADPSACTLIAARISGGSVTVGNVGDSRAYWLNDDGSGEMLSTDDSIAQARIMLGMSRTDAEQSSQAHALTKWLGRQATDVTPSMVSFKPTGSGWLLLCSDGLWNYASSPSVMSGLLRASLANRPEPAQLAEALVAWANDQGGRDNITAVVARIEG